MFAKLARWVVKRFALDFAKHESPDLEKRAALRAAPFPDAWRAIVVGELPHYKRLTLEQRAKLHGDIAVFVGEKTIVGMDGFVVDDRAKVIVAASAALVALGTDIAMFDHVTRVVIYPGERVPDVANAGGRYQAMRSQLGDEVIETWGEVELAWDNVGGAFGRLEGQNTGVHEFAHAFDHADSKLDALQAHPHFERWRAKLHRLPLSRRREGWTVITEVIPDVEGPELFASATELFFECPRKLRMIDESLFDTLCDIYKVDPRSFVDS